jgi:hypothetical protein
MWECVMDKAVLGQVLFEYFGFPANHSTNFDLVITQGWHNTTVRAEWTQWNGTPPLYQ